MSYKLFIKNTFVIVIFFTRALCFTNEANDKKLNRVLPILKKIEKNNKKVTFIGSFKFNEKIKCPIFYLCFNGKLIKITKKNYCSFLIKDFDRKKLKLIFVSAKNIHYNADCNTISSLKILDDNYKFYILKKETAPKLNFESDLNDEFLTWNITEINNKEKPSPFKVPLNSLIVFVDPSSIKINLKNVQWKKNSIIVKIPQIIINNIIDEEKFEKSCLDFLNIKSFHIEQEKNEICDDKTKRCILI